MALKPIIDSLDGVPEALHSFYSEKDGKFSLAVEGMAPKARVDEFRDTNIALKREMDDLRARYDGVDPDKFREMSDKAQKERDRKLIDAGKIEEMLAERVGAMKGDHEKALGSLKGENEKLLKQLEGLVVDNAIRDAAAKASVRATAVDDVLLRGRQVFRLLDGKAVPMEGDKPVYGKDGEPMTISEWVGSLGERAPHLFEQSTGSGARGSAGGEPGKKTITRAQFDTLDPASKSATIRGGIQVVD